MSSSWWPVAVSPDDLVRLDDAPAHEADVRTCAEEVLHLLAAHGIELLFLNPGTDSAPLQEAFVALSSRGWPQRTATGRRRGVQRPCSSTSTSGPRT